LQSEKVGWVTGFVQAIPRFKRLGIIKVKLFEDMVGKINGGCCASSNDVSIGDGWPVLIERLFFLFNRSSRGTGHHWLPGNMTQDVKKYRLYSVYAPGEDRERFEKEVAYALRSCVAECGSM